MQYMQTACFTHVHFPIIASFRYWCSETLFDIAFGYYCNKFCIFIFIVSITRAQCDNNKSRLFFCFETHTKCVLLYDMIRFYGYELIFL